MRICLAVYFLCPMVRAMVDCYLDRFNEADLDGSLDYTRSYDWAITMSFGRDYAAKHARLGGFLADMEPYRLR